MKEFAEEVQTADDGVNLAFHILNTVDIPIGKYQGNKNSRNHSSNDSKNEFSFEKLDFFSVSGFALLYMFQC